MLERHSAALIDMLDARSVICPSCELLPDASLVVLSLFILLLKEQYNSLYCKKICLNAVEKKEHAAAHQMCFAVLKVHSK